MFGKEKNIDNTVTPEELSKFNDKSTAAPEVEHFHITTDSTEIVKLKKRRKILTAILAAVASILLVLFLVSMLVTQWGDLIIEIDSPLIKKGLVLSEEPEFKVKSATLSAKQQQNVTNITYNWLPVDLDTSEDGSHNGDNYVAYTFYVRNEGQEKLDYDAVLDIRDVAKSADEAARIMVYKNGKPEIYGKGTYADREKAEQDCTKFVDNKVVMTTRTEGMDVQQVDKYTIVIWIEGNDPECVDDIRDGHIRMRMLFQVDEDRTDGVFGNYYNGEYVEDTRDYNDPNYTVSQQATAAQDTREVSE